MIVIPASCWTVGAALIIIGFTSLNNKSSSTESDTQEHSNASAVGLIVLGVIVFGLGILLMNELMKTGAIVP